MRGGAASGLRRPATGRLALATLLAAAVVLAMSYLLGQLPRPVAAMGTLDQCMWGWPVVVFEGEDWKAALPDDIRPYAQRQIPVADWPSGMRFDEATGALLDAQGVAFLRKGDRVRVAGTIVRTQGDPAPCFYTLGVRIDSITTR